MLTCENVNPQPGEKPNTFPPARKRLYPEPREGHVPAAVARAPGTPRRTSVSSPTSSMAASIACSSLSARQGYAPARVSVRAGASPVAAVRAPLRVVAKESRIGKHPVPVPKGVTYTLKDNHLAVKVRSPRHLSYHRISLSCMRRDSVVGTSPLDPPRAARGRRHADRVLGFWSILSLTSPPLLLCLQGPKGELAFQFPPTMVMTEVRLSRRAVCILIGARAVSTSPQRCHILTCPTHFSFCRRRVPSSSPRRTSPRRLVRVTVCTGLSATT